MSEESALRFSGRFIVRVSDVAVELGDAVVGADVEDGSHARSVEDGPRRAPPGRRRSAPIAAVRAVAAAFMGIAAPGHQAARGLSD